MKIPARLVAFATPLAFAAMSLAQDGHDQAGHADHAHEKASVIPTTSQGIMPMLVTLFVFCLVMAVLALKVWPTIVQGLKDRENKIREEIESAELARKQAKDALEQYQQSLQQARAEATKMIEQTKAQQAALAADLKARADAEVAQLRERAVRDIEAAKRAAVAEIYGEAANLASAMAGKILRRQINVDDQKALVEETLGQLQGMKN
jgi:F-type H+-transporting ATPase subunit b